MRRRVHWMFAGFLVAIASGNIVAQSKPVPKIALQAERYALMLGDQPYFILGAQIHNSGFRPAMLPQPMKAAEVLHANTEEAPVYWETMEEHSGVYDPSNVDAVVQQARAHPFHLVLLWFGSWKTCCSYTPEWTMSDPKKYPRIMTRSSDPTSERSLYSAENLNAEKKAFSSLLEHIKATDDAEQTVIMIQEQNEAGALNAVRDSSSESKKLFDGQVPDCLVRAMHKRPERWQEAFGKDVEEPFSPEGISRFINEFAKAGKAVYPLPTYVNAWLGTPDGQMRPGFDSPSGGPAFNVFDIWKAVAPEIRTY
jgi:hypothetical protein